MYRRVASYCISLLQPRITYQYCPAVTVAHARSIVSTMKDSRGSERMAIKTQGISFRDVWKHSNIIDVNEIQTNDIFAMLRIYGVEAARHTIQQQIESVSEKYCMFDFLCVQI